MMTIKSSNTDDHYFKFTPDSSLILAKFIEANKDFKLQKSLSFIIQQFNIIFLQ